MDEAIERKNTFHEYVQNINFTTLQSGILFNSEGPNKLGERLCEGLEAIGSLPPSAYTLSVYYTGFNAFTDKFVLTNRQTHGNVPSNVLFDVQISVRF